MTTEFDTQERLAQSVEQLTVQIDGLKRRMRRLQSLLGAVAVVAVVLSLAVTLAPSAIETARAQMYQPAMPYGGQPMRQGPSAQRPSARVPSSDRERILRRALAQLDDPNDFDSEAAIAVYLYDLNRNLSSLSSVGDELGTISRQLDANTHIANEMREMNLKMTTITKSIDSTMGVMGRMMNQMLLYSY
jgi:hypothetical protein